MWKLLDWCPRVNSACLSQVCRSTLRPRKPRYCRYSIYSTSKPPLSICPRLWVTAVTTSICSKPETPSPNNHQVKKKKWTRSRLCLQYFPSFILLISLLSFSSLFLALFASHHSHLWCPPPTCVWFNVCSHAPSRIMSMLLLIFYTLNSGLSPNYSPHHSPLCCTITRFPCALLTLPVVCCYLEIPTRTLTHTCAVLCTSVF